MGGQRYYASYSLAVVALAKLVAKKKQNSDLCAN
jgi:hypothetical protein